VSTNCANCGRTREEGATLCPNCGSSYPEEAKPRRIERSIHFWPQIFLGALLGVIFSGLWGYFVLGILGANKPFATFTSNVALMQLATLVTCAALFFVLSRRAGGRIHPRPFLTAFLVVWLGAFTACSSLFYIHL